MGITSCLSLQEQIVVTSPLLWTRIRTLKAACKPVDLQFSVVLSDSKQNIMIIGSFSALLSVPYLSPPSCVQHQLIDCAFIYVLFAPFAPEQRLLKESHLPQLRVLPDLAPAPTPE